MQIGFAGLGRMGGNMVERLRRGGFLGARPWGMKARSRRQGMANAQGHPR